MKRLTFVTLVCAMLSGGFVAGCGTADSETSGSSSSSSGNAGGSSNTEGNYQPAQTSEQAPSTSTGSDLIDNSNEIANDPNKSAELKVAEICEQMKASGSFDGTGVSPEEVGC